ncbi:molecular chaperone HscC [Hyphomonas sp. CACIAM 19H1]|uniref:molecular chaperone HscC n=1 Tax=Hyphomonas sp. CACIAM 19H1 TaxID=1873716 RepID=UPI000DEDCCEE|nr:molecular chaperone HscC [Hyphomonas sp. CACIAM 19H1]AXE64484.1 molecular chaperone HscC [Hyphomonas sp. CACIAM 19H1]
MSDKAIIGIDLGTTNSLVAVFEADGPTLVPNALGEVMTPSAVGYGDDGAVLVGRAARDRLLTHPDLTTARFKRYMGTNHEVKLGKKSFRPEELSALVLGSLRADAEAHLGRKVEEAVISVPAYFNDIQRKATITAAEFAGLKVNRLVNEPTAAALAYGLQDKEAESTFLVVDLGGGTFDVSILEMFSGVMEVRASAGDAFLGGEDFTDTLATELGRQLGIQPKDVSREEGARLRALANRLKHQLSEKAEATGEYVIKGEARPVSISREKFDEITDELLKRLRMPIQRAISDASLRADDLHRIITVGGATRMQAVRGLITRLFKRFPEHSIDPDHVVALGAAVQAGLAARHAALDDVVMTDVCPFTLGYEVSVPLGPNQWEPGHFSPLIERNTVVPASRANEISPLEQHQREINLMIYQGESPFVRDNVRIGQLRVPLPADLKADKTVEVRYTYDTSGILEVEATPVATKKTLRLVIEGTPGTMTRAEIDKRLKELTALKIHPRDEQENAAIIARLRAAYENSLGDQRQHIGHILAQFEAVLHTHDKRQIQDARAQIEEILSRFEGEDVF